MKCQEAIDVIHAYVDGELDLVKTLDVENHIRDCNECSTIHRSLIVLRSSIRDASLYFRAPSGLERKVRSQVGLARTGTARHRLFTGRWLAAAAALAMVVTTAWVLLRGVGGGSEGLLASEITSAHIRSLMAEHLWDVKSGDQHTVKPWFDGKLNFAPEVRDFKAESFALEGGRLDYLADRPVAALVYRHEKHFINLFVWPAAGQVERSKSVIIKQGYVLIHWINSGMNYWAVSDTSEEVLGRFTNLVHGLATQATTQTK